MYILEMASLILTNVGEMDSTSLYKYSMEDLNAKVFTGCAYFALLIFPSIFSAEAANIGVVINTSTRAGREQRVAIEIAAQLFNSSSSPLLLSFNSLSGVDDLLELPAKANELIDWGADVIIGAVETWPEAATLAKAGNAAGIPILSLAAAAATTPTLSPASQLVQISSPMSGEVRCLTDIIISYKWRRVIVIYEEDVYGSFAGVAALLSDSLRAGGSQIDHHIAFPPLHTISGATDLIRQNLEDIPQQLAKVFVVLRASPELAFQLFKEAKGLSMVERGYVWILNDDVTALLDSALGHPISSSYMQGVVGISTYFNTTTISYHNFSTSFQQRFKQEFEFEGEHRHFEPGKYAILAYDAVQGIARAAAARAAENVSMAASLENIFSSNLTAGLERFSFSEDGHISTAFRVLNVAGKSYREVGFWAEGFGFYQNEVEMGRHGRGVDVLGPVIWPGGKVKTPGGWGKLRVGVPNHTTFEQFVKVKYDTTTWKAKHVTGFCIDVFKKIVESMDHDLVYEFIPFSGSYDHLVNQISLKEIDAAVGDITILAKRSVNASFTESFLSSGLTMMVPIKPSAPWMLTEPFTKEVWSMILAAMIYTAGVVWYLERSNNPEFDGAWPVQLGATIWLTFSTIFFAHDRIYSYYTKAVIMVWLIVVLILTSSFTANLGSMLTVQKLEPMTPGSRVGYDGDHFVFKYLEMLGYSYQNVVWIKNAEAYNEAFKSGSISAAFLETPYLRVFLSKYKNYTAKGRTHRLGGFGFAFPRGSPLAADFSEVILKLTEDGTLSKLEKKWFSVILTNSPEPNNGRTRDSLGLDCFWLLFVCSGCTSTIILLLFSVRSSFFQQNRSKNSIPQSSLR